MFESYELMLQDAVRKMDEEAVLDLLACDYKAFSNKVDADACAWSVGRNVVYRNSFKVWLVPLSETCENAFRSIGLEWCSVDVDEPGESFTDDLYEAVWVTSENQIRQATLIRLAAGQEYSDYFVDNGMEPIGSTRPYREYEKAIADDLATREVEYEIVEGYEVAWSQKREEAYLAHDNRVRYTNFSGYTSLGVAYTPSKEVAAFLETLPLEEEVSEDDV